MRREYFFRILVCLSIAITSIAGQQSNTPSTQEESMQGLKGIKERGGLLMGTDPYGEGASKLKYLEQGWGVPETLWYYHADQGSVLIPRDVLLHLEQADSVRPFLDPENMTRFRFLTQKKTPNNPDALPIGFARHKDDIGFTCAECHTGQIVYRGTAIRIDGAPALIDMIGFFSALRDAEKATLEDEEKLTRFARALPAKSKEAFQNNLNSCNIHGTV